MAVCSKHLELLQLLIDNNAAVAQGQVDNWNAVHFAALNGWEPGLRLLLEQDQSLANAVTAHGTPPLVFAVKNSHTGEQRCMQLAVCSIYINFFGVAAQLLD